METEDIEDGEILEDESNDGEAPSCEPEKSVEQLPPEEKNNFERFFSKDKRTHHHHRPRGHQESHKSFRRDRASFPASGLKKRRRSDEDAYRSEKFYAKKNKRSDADAEDGNEDDMIFMLGGQLRDVERKMKSSKKPTAPSLPETMIDPIAFNEGENQDPRPYARRSPPSERRDRMKKDRGGLVRGVGGGLLKRRGGRGGPVVRKENQRDTANEICSFFAQGKCLRGSDCPYLHPCNQPRKLEICKFYLNDCCTKRDKCIYMHSDFPCKYFHLPGLTCSLGTKCKFSHSKLDEVQRAVLKKYADLPMKEVDEMQRFYRETANGAPPARSKEKKDSRIPSLFDIRVAVPREYREGQEGDGVTTPIPSPESMVYDNDDSEEKPHKHHHKHSKILAEHNEHKHGEELEPTGSETTPKHKKKSRKTDEFSDGERSRKDKKKKKSKKEDKDGERSEKRRRKKDRVRKSKVESIEDAFAVGLDLHDDGAEVNTDEKIERETADAFAHLPKKQQELFLRIQQHQKEADTSQNANVDEQNEEDDSKPDVNWYSSDEEETPEPAQEESASSPLATLLRTIQTTSSSSNSSNIVPNIEKAIDGISAPANLFSTPPVPDSESVPMVDASQLANIDLSDEVTQILTSIMKTESGSSGSDTTSNTLPSDPERINDYLSLSSSSSALSVVRKPFPGGGMEMLPSFPVRKTSSEDLGAIFRHSAVFGFSGATPRSSDSPPKDIDLRQLPFKPIPVHDAANEIDASITSHPPMEYKLIPLSPIPKVNYATMIDAARNAARDDPRFKRKAPVAVTESMTEPIAKPSDPRFELKAHSEGAMRSDPRIRNDPRLAAAKNIPAMPSVPVMPPMMVDPRMDPRLLACNPFPTEQTFSSYQMAAVAAAAAAAAVSSLPQSGLSMLAKEPTSLRKEDPRLRFRTNQNA